MRASSKKSLLADCGFRFLDRRRDHQSSLGRHIAPYQSISESGKISQEFTKVAPSKLQIPCNIHGNPKRGLMITCLQCPRLFSEISTSGGEENLWTQKRKCSNERSSSSLVLLLSFELEKCENRKVMIAFCEQLRKIDPTNDGGLSSYTSLSFLTHLCLNRIQFWEPRF